MGGGKSRSDDSGLRGQESQAWPLWLALDEQDTVLQDSPASLAVLSATDSLEMEHRSLLLVVFQESSIHASLVASSMLPCDCNRKDWAHCVPKSLASSALPTFVC